ncbi:MAG: bifunctional hydroxymethylpyrimidine kinase/phosphomethylpyrimidine kinase [Syntrophothermus sp.]
MKRVLTIAGSDSGGGAGIQADLKTFSALGTYGASVITAVTAQNTTGVLEVRELEPEFVGRQLDAVFQDIGADAVKTGMVANAGIIRVVAAKILEYRAANLVVDPVMVAKNGAHLLAPEAKAAMIELLLPMAYVVTPNLMEAEELTGIYMESPEDMELAAYRIHDMGSRYVLVKGGHLPGDAADLLFDGNEFRWYRSARIETRHTHGTGCTFSAAIAAWLARGLPVPEAVQRAKEYITAAIEKAFPLGHGVGPVNHLYNFKFNLSDFNEGDEER